jgi:uncharacterized protein YktA (UPF0223 family)
MYIFFLMLIIAVVVIAVSLIVLVCIEIQKHNYSKLIYSMSDKWDEHSIDCFYEKINNEIEYSLEELSDQDLDKIRENKDLKIAVNAVLNFFEGVGYAYNRNIIDKEYAESCFSDPIITAYKRYFSIINESRIKHNDSRMLCEFEKMSKLMIKNREKYNKKISK